MTSIISVREVRETEFPPRLLRYGAEDPFNLTLRVLKRYGDIVG